MGILWTTFPLSEEVKLWLDEEGVHYPEIESGYPTGNEIKAALKRISGFRVKISYNGIGHIFQAFIESNIDKDSWTLLNIDEYTGDDNPQELWFEKGDETLIKKILTEISEVSGPIVLVADAGGVPEVIYNKR